MLSHSPGQGGQPEKAAPKRRPHAPGMSKEGEGGSGGALDPESGLGKGPSAHPPVSEAEAWEGCGAGLGGGATGRHAGVCLTPAPRRVCPAGRPPSLRPGATPTLGTNCQSGTWRFQSEGQRPTKHPSHLLWGLGPSGS